MSSTKRSSLISRSPGSRKSLGVTSTAGPPIVKRKRAHSIAPVENVKLEFSKPSSLRPPKGILKPSNQPPADDITQDFTQGYNTIPFNRSTNVDASDTTVLSEFQTNINSNSPRKSLGGRRVSFAAHAHVRVFECAEQNTNGSDSPNSSPVPAPNHTPSHHEQGQHGVSAVASAKRDSPSRRGSLGHERRATHEFHDDEGEASMELSDDVPGGVSQPFQPQQEDEDSDEEEDMRIDGDGDMSMTSDFGPGIISRRQSSAGAGGRRKSRMRSSIIVPLAEQGTEPTDFTVDVDRPPPPETDAFKALKALANDSRTGEDNTAQDSQEVDMDVTTAVSRLMAVRNSLGGAAPSANNAPSADDTFTSSEESFDEVDTGDRTMNMTSIMGSFRISDHGIDQADITMSAASVVGGSPILATSTPTSSQRTAQATSSSIPIPVFRKSNPTIQSSIPKSPSKQFLPTLSSPKKPQASRTSVAAFTPSFQVSKRPAPSPNISSSPAKKRAVSTAAAPDQRPISVPVGSQGTGQTSPKKNIKGRRPSGYYRNRKSLGTSVQSTANTTDVTRHEVFVEPSGPVSEKSSSKTATYAQSTSKENKDLNTLTSPRDRIRDDEPITITSSQVDVVPHHDDLSSSVVDPSQWAATVQDATIPSDNDMEPISVEQFFIMTGVRFMDDMACPRRSMHPSQLQRRESTDGDEDFTFSSYAVAMAIDVAQLETMIWIANDIRSAIDKYKTQYRQTEEDAAKDMPSLFREFITASEEDRVQILYVLKILKAHTVALARASWYDWKRGWIQGLQTNAERTLENLDADERQLLHIAERAEISLPSLRQEYKDIMHELQEEQVAVSEIESCDQGYLAELKLEIASQRDELDIMRNNLKEVEAKVARLEETIEDLNEQTSIATKAISAAERQMDLQKTSARAEVFRLRNELRSLQDVHLWKTTHINNDLVEFVYDHRYKVVIPCRRFSPIPEALNVVPVASDPEKGDDFPVLTRLMYKLARHHALQADTKLSLPMILQRLSDFWSSYTQLRWQLKFILVKHPLSCKLLPEGASVNEAEALEATATLLLNRKTAKISVSFLFGAPMFSSWPRSLKSLEYDVRVIYGGVEPKSIKEAIEDRLNEASLEENHACLLDACMEVLSRYS